MSSAAGHLLDLSVALGPNPSEVVPIEVETLDHRAGGVHLAQLAGISPEELPGGLGWASEKLTALTHTGTHMDAPFHYGPVCQGRPSRTVDELPLEWFWGPGVCVDVRGGAEAEPVELAEVESFEKTRGLCIGPGTITIFFTGAQRHHGTAGYPDRGRSLSPRLVEELTRRGVRVLATDAWSIDPPFSRLRAAGGAPPSKVWAGHFVGRRVEFCILERLCNLHLLPAAGFRVACFPIKVVRGSAGWVRAVAFLEPNQGEDDA